jgi:hypothetical protein
MKRVLIGAVLVAAGCSHQPELTAEQRWYYAPESCHKVLIATGPVSVAPKDWTPSNSKKVQKYRAELTDASKEYIEHQCGAYPGTKPQKS